MGFVYKRGNFILNSLQTLPHTGQPGGIDLMCCERFNHILANTFNTSRFEYLRLSLIFDLSRQVRTDKLKLTQC